MWIMDFPKKLPNENLFENMDPQIFAQLKFIFRDFGF